VNTGPRTLLIVDDQESARETLAALLAADMHRLLFAASGREAIEVLAGENVDVVLCDVMMPGLDGFGVCRQVRQRHEWRLIPIILVTALDEREDVVRGLDAGADEFLSKPIDKLVLHARLRVVLRHHDEHREARTAVDVDALFRGRRQRLISAAGLTEREREVLDLLLLGRTHKEIGTVLGISARTANFHQTNILQKLDADSRMDLLRIFL